VGTLQPVDDIGALAHEHGVALHVDAAQAFGRLPIHVHAWRADTMTISGHKAHGPQGSGALYVRRGVPREPWLSGGHHEAGRRPGTESVAGIVGLGRLAELIRAHLQDDIQQMQQLRDRLERELTTRIEDVRLNGHPTARLCNTLNVRVPDVSGEALVIQLDLEGIAISTGAACSSGMREPSHVLLAMGRTVEEAEQCVRFSVGRFTTNDEITRVIDAVERAVARMRSVARPSVVAARA
jgi:cysteine desulfurase